jgi:hypothetical protein
MMMVPFPSDVRGYDWTLPASAGPPDVTVGIGYQHWWDDERGRCSRRYYVHPDGSASMVETDESGDLPDETVYPAGAWRVVYPTTTFGSRGGCFVERIPRRSK